MEWTWMFLGAWCISLPERHQQSGNEVWTCIEINARISPCCLSLGHTSASSADGRKGLVPVPFGWSLHGHEGGQLTTTSTCCRPARDVSQGWESAALIAGPRPQQGEARARGSSSPLPSSLACPCPSMDVMAPKPVNGFRKSVHESPRIKVQECLCL